MFFKGYVETKGKKCIEKFKNRKDFKSYDQVERLDGYAGILAAETVLVDIDDNAEFIKQVEVSISYLKTMG